MNTKISKQGILSSLEDALNSGQIYPVFQPKVNHLTGRMIGAEALMRWNHPVHGSQVPDDFVPMLEKMDMLNKADITMFDHVCKFQRKCIDNNVPSVPISCNMSRFDFMHDDFIDNMEEIRKKNDIPSKMLPIEITESSAIGGIDLMSKTIEKLHHLGYKVEIDDFGSGYSSLYILNDLMVDVIKLDIRLLKGRMRGRGGAIINAIVQMAKWLDTPVIALGVETMEQADFMRSIGCSYVQGYLYSKPLADNEFIHMLLDSDHEAMSPIITAPEMEIDNFWDPDSLETLIFNNYVGGAAILSYMNGKPEIIRVNKKYMQEIGMNMTEAETLKSNLFDSFDLDNRKIYEKALRDATESGNEEICETWRNICSKTCGNDKICVRSHIRLLGKADEHQLFYVMVQNITLEKNQQEALARSEKTFRYAAEHDKSFAWEYEIATKKMRPCSRCIRELGLPPLLENYPEPVIASRLFQPDYADAFREMHDKIAAGEPYLEKVFLLTDDRLPFIIRYTTEFDENGKPLKAYGSATPLEHDKKE